MEIGQNIKIIDYTTKVDYTPLSDKLFRLDSLHYTIWENNSKRYYITEVKGFRWDGATIFRIFWSILGLTRSGIMLAPSLWHDGIYKKKGIVYNHLTQEWDFISRKHTDQLFYIHMLHSNVGKKQAKLSYQLIRVFGRLYWRDFSDILFFKRKK
jgi:hypothetical protein